jgi:Asp-tRNA(Asn)/Glu-tRNA(Gln) amidotransferase B subunit
MALAATSRQLVLSAMCSLRLRPSFFLLSVTTPAKPHQYTLISHIDVGMPGALPVLNEGAIELACLRLLR